MEEEVKGKKLSPEDARVALRDHALALARRGFEKYGGKIVPEEILQDQEIVRYPTTLRFGAERLQPGEFAFPEPLGETAADGFCLHVHPCFEDQAEALPLLVSYQIVAINYGGMATAEDAEWFGAVLLGLDKEAYYRRLCRLADSIPA